MPHKLIHAAFRTPHGDVYTTGAFHDLNAVPEHIDQDTLEAGFVTPQGDFLTRDEATAEWHLQHPIQSEELELEKTELHSTDKKEFEHLLRTWLQKRLKQKVPLPVPVDAVLKSMREAFVDVTKSFDGEKINDDLMEAAARQTGMDVQQLPEFEAARFLAGGKTIGPEVEHRALLVHGEDVAAAALYAYGLEIVDSNREALKAVMATEALQKADLDVAALPRDIEPVFPESRKTVDSLRRAFVGRQVTRMQVKGKHSFGIAVAYDEKEHKHFLLKPGSGAPSPAAGVADDPVNQSRREVAFVKIAQAWGLGADFPGCELVLIDGQEVAAMDLLPPAYVNIGRCRDDAVKILRPYEESGELYKWAVIDMVLGQADRHSGNLMVNPDDYDRVKLIDEGSTFAGPDFNPAQDPKSYIPYYLRAFSGESFRKLTPEGRYELMPHPNHELRESIQSWIDGLQDSDVRQVLVQYGIQLNATLDRLNLIQSSENGIDVVLRFWAGLR